MIEQAVEVLTLIALLIPFTYFFKVIMNLKTKVALLEAEIEVVLKIIEKVYIIGF